MIDKINMSSSELEIFDMCSGKTWFNSLDHDQYGRLVVYVNYMNGEVSRLVPDLTHDGKQILTHFAAASKDNSQKYLNKIENSFDLKKFMDSAQQASKNEADVGFGQMIDTLEQESILESSVQFLTDELDRLEKICGTNILGEIFFECHDGKNAVTNLSSRYPEVRSRINFLYEKYGFDLLYDEMEL